MTMTIDDDEPRNDRTPIDIPLETRPDALPSDPAARWFLWRDSAEHADFAGRRRWAHRVIALLGVIAVGILAVTYIFPTHQDPLSILAIICIGAGLYIWSIFILLERRARREFEDRLRLGMAKKIGDEEKELAKHAAADGQLNFAKLWSINQDRIEYYHGIARTQAENSYKSAQRAGIVGFIAVLGLGALAAFATSGTASIAAAAVGVAGAAMSAYIGATFMKIQAEASSQFRQFFREPVEVSRLLGAERLINTLDDQADKAKAVQIVVNAMMTDTSTPTASDK